MDPSRSGEGADFDHAQRVAAWFDSVAKGLPAEHLLECFEVAFRALWLRAHVTLGDVTLNAIASRVLCSASEKFPALASLHLEDRGLEFQNLKENSADLRPDHLEAGIQLALTEFLSVLGSLTAEILSPALHEELAKVGREQWREAEGSPPSPADRESGTGAKESPE